MNTNNAVLYPLVSLGTYESSGRKQTLLGVYVGKMFVTCKKNPVSYDEVEAIAQSVTCNGKRYRLPEPEELKSLCLDPDNAEDFNEAAEYWIKKGVKFDGWGGYAWCKGKPDSDVKFVCRLSDGHIEPVFGHLVGEHDRIILMPA